MNWLLRLFESDFFNAWIAVSYLFKYIHTPGIQFYLCERLKEFNIEEIQFFLPQLCHLLLFHGVSVAALEDLIMFCCGKSTHFAILMYWQLDAYLDDLSDRPMSSSFQVCKRVHSKCLKLILPQFDGTADLTEDEATSFYPNIEASLVFMGAKIGSLLGRQERLDPLNMAHMFLKQPLVTSNWSRSSSYKSFSLTGQISKRNSSYSAVPAADQPRRVSDSEEPRNKNSRWFKRKGKFSASSIIPDVSMEELHTGDAFSLGRFLQKANSGRSLSSELIRPESAPANNIQSSNSESPFKVNLRTTAILNNIKDALNFKLPERIGSNDEIVDLTGEHRPQTAESQHEHYFHSEVQFIKALDGITRRLMVLPKPARQSSLRAELSLLNHNLPAKVCIPLWCSASEETPLHHVLVRIVVNEGVVLNSAEKVPFLILVEVLEVQSEAEIHEIMAKRSELGDADNSVSSSNFVDLGMSSSAVSDRDISSVISKSGFVTKTSLSRVSNISGTSIGNEKDLLNGDKVALMEINTNNDQFFPKMRAAAIMLAQLSHSSPKIQSSVADVIRQRILKEMAFLEEDRMKLVVQERMEKSDSRNSMRPSIHDLQPINLNDSTSAEEQLMADQKLMDSMLKEDPSASVFKEPWSSKQERVRQASPFGKYPGWNLVSVIFKTGSDLRQEQLACQLIREFKVIWKQENVDVWVYYYRVLITSSSTGLIETISNSVSVHSIKKEAHARGLGSEAKVYSLYDHFLREFGPVSSDAFKNAQKNFVKSLAAYSLITYFLSIKDRHNGNILVDHEGHIIHIDFGFMLLNSPGSVGFEAAPFKLSQEYIDIMGGLNSPTFYLFKELLHKGFMSARKHADKIILLVEMMTKDSSFPCFAGNGQAAVAALRNRFETTLTEKQVEGFIDGLIIKSHNNMFTRLYDTFQWYSNGILY